MGDIIYSLPTVAKMMKGFHVCTFVTGLPRKLHELIAPLLRVQPYIGDVLHISETELPIGFINLDWFVRSPHNTRQHIVNAHRESQGLPLFDFKKEGEWLWVPSAPTLVHGRYAVINVTSRYRDKIFNWSSELEWLLKKVDRIYFVGLPEEWIEFKTKYKANSSKVVYYKIENYLQAVYLIKNAAYFSGNQSSLLAIRQALALPYRMEQSPNHVDCNQYSERETILNPWTRKVHKTITAARMIINDKPKF